MNLLDALLNGTLNWREPLWLWALLLPLLLGLMKRLIVTQQQQQYADAPLWPWVAVTNTAHSSRIKKFTPPYRRPLATLFMTLAWCSLILALAGPRTLIHSPNAASREGVDVLVSMDLSHSMTATDYYPNRFLFAKSLVESMSNQLKPTDRLALQAFAGHPHFVSPLSDDRALFEHFLNLLEPNLLPLQGSWVERAVLEGFEHLALSGGESRLLVLFTNGAPPFWQPPELPDSFINSDFYRNPNNTIQLVIVGVGKLSATSLHNPSDANQLWQVNGQPVTSRLEENRLKKLAQSYGGHYLRAEPSQAFMQQLLQAIAQPAGKRPPKQDRATWQDHAQPFIIMGFISLLLAFYLLELLGGVLRSLPLIQRKKFPPPSQHHSLIWLAGLLSLSLFSLPPSATAAPLTPASITTLHSADRAYQAQQYEDAYQLYRQVRSYQGSLGAGDAAYQLGNIETAIIYFRQAAWQANQEGDRAKALFNLGNSYYQIQLFDLAIQAYQQALIYQPKNNKAQHNLALAQHAKQIQPLQKRANGAGNGDGKGEQGKQGTTQEGAFYGGQKPNASNGSEQGFGSDGDAPEGEKQGQKVILSNEGQQTQYQLNPSATPFVLNAQNERHLNQDSTANLVLTQQQVQQDAARFKQKIQQLEDNQKRLLKRLFEREAGFHAPQEKPHPIPGVPPW
ncbi:MAG: VWA domain-containing protein [Thiomicrorhabdus sp.]|nr:VWA domain-containing protein [Thiomicrorhabdus sp.]